MVCVIIALPAQAKTCCAQGKKSRPHSVQGGFYQRITYGTVRFPVPEESYASAAAGTTT
jgi:hypothetical protein